MMKPETDICVIEDAESLAYRAIAFIAADQAYLSDFLTRTGVAQERLPELLESRDFLVAVLDHLLGDESLLLAFCGNAGIDPSEVLPARKALSPFWQM
jgi:hypothetical protein